jgi:NAD(P)-dependent dehydrogenase (short-subunit alcohol dehydrogenase family)
MARLTGKVAVVTGGNSGMGLATARLFVQEGAEVVVTGRRQNELDAALKSIGAGAYGFAGDIASLADNQSLHDFAKEKFGRVDIVFANAGGGVLTPFGNVSEADFDKTVGINLKGTFFSVQALLPLMPDGGSIILNASIAATKGQPAFTVYAATKAALRSFARTWTTDLAPRKIRVNSISPGYIATPILMSAAGFTKEESDAFFASEGAKTPAGRPGRAEEIATAVLFLASDESSYVTGIDLPIDGGVAQV